MDFRVIYENANHVPPRNSGIIVVKARPNTADRLARMLIRFKDKFPKWPCVDWSGVYLEIDEAEIYISRLVDGNIDDGTNIRFDAEDFSGRFTEIIAALHAPLPNNSGTPTPY